MFMNTSKGALPAGIESYTPIQLRTMIHPVMRESNDMNYPILTTARMRFTNDPEDIVFGTSRLCNPPNYPNRKATIFSDAMFGVLTTYKYLYSKPSLHLEGNTALARIQALSDEDYKDQVTDALWTIFEPDSFSSYSKPSDNFYTQRRNHVSKNYFLHPETLRVAVRKTQRKNGKAAKRQIIKPQEEMSKQLFQVLSPLYKEKEQIPLLDKDDFSFQQICLEPVLGSYPLIRIDILDAVKELCTSYTNSQKLFRTFKDHFGLTASEDDTVRFPFAWFFLPTNLYAERVRTSLCKAEVMVNIMDFLRLVLLKLLEDIRDGRFRPSPFVTEQLVHSYIANIFWFRDAMLEQGEQSGKGLKYLDLGLTQLNHFLASLDIETHERYRQNVLKALENVNHPLFRQRIKHLSGRRAWYIPQEEDIDYQFREDTYARKETSFENMYQQIQEMVKGAQL